MTKFQIPNKFQKPNSKFQLSWSLVLGIWSLFGAWNLELGICQQALAKEKARIEIKVEEKEARLDTTSQAQVIIPSQVKGQAQTVPQLLERVAGVTLKQYGGLDDFAAISIRGSTTEQVLIYLDGALLNSAHGGVLDLSFLPLDQIEKIEVYKGGAPGKTADSAPGGVIYIQTKKKPEKTSHILRQELGSFFTYRGHLERSQALKPFYYHAAFDHFRSRGDFPFLDDRGTRANRNDDRTVRRQNNDFQSYDFSTTLGQGQKDSLHWKLYENFFLKHEGIPGFGSQTSTRSRLNTLRNLLSAEFGSPDGSNKKMKWQTDLFFDVFNSRFQDRQGQIGLGTQDNDDVTLRLGPKFSLSYLLSKNHFLTGFLAHRAEFFWPTNEAATPPDGPLSQRHMIGIGLEDEMSFLSDKIIIDPSIRFQIFVNDLSGADPSRTQRTTDNNVTDQQISAKLGLKLSPWPFLNFKSNLFRGFRQPTFAELFGDRGTIVGNPQLQPEESFNFDFGFELVQKNLGFLDWFQLSMVYFRHNIDHLIQFSQTSQFTIRADNLNEALIQGGEFATAFRLFKHFRCSSHYVYQIAKDDEPTSPTFGLFLPGRPKHQFFMEADYQFRYVRPFVELQMMGNNYLDSQNLLLASRRTLLASGLHVSPVKKLTLTFQVKNTLNDQIVDVVGYPLPGRSYWGEGVLEF